MVDVFISYARANRDVVCRVAEAIGRLGYVVWWDEELPAHLSYGEVITQKIVEAKATLVVWSAESAASEWVRAEADMARNQKKLIQTSIDDCIPPLPFNQIQFAAIGDWQGEEDHAGWRKVRASLAALCGLAPAGSLAAAPGPVTPESVATVAARSAPPPFVSRPAPKRSLNRMALIAITASVMTILTVGGLVLVNGPPRAQATATATPAPAPARQPNQDALPPKTAPVEAVAEPGDTIGVGVETEPSSEAAAVTDDF